LKIPQDIIFKVLADHFSQRPDLAELNQKAVAAGQTWAQGQHSSHSLPTATENRNKILMDGNTAAALGLLFGGCTVATWYPITPSTSLMETFISYASQYRKDGSGHNNFVALQVEDELAAISGVLGAGWAGARALTCTSGPGLSLMAEAAGFAYYAEIPSVIWDVQRAGPSTGLPTRTQQSDLIFARYLSHGDTLHPCLLPGNPQECFEFGQLCFDLAERLQQLVIVLSDLDLGMNLWMSEEFPPPNKPFDRGKVLSLEDLDQKKDFFRYQDTDQDGLCYRTLPGTKHPRAAYFTRGSGHNDKAQYTENPKEYQDNIDRLKIKNETAKALVPPPLISGQNSQLGVISYGATEAVLIETQALLKKQAVTVDLCRIRALPFTQEVADFIAGHEKIIVIDQNSQGQMKMLLSMELPSSESKLSSLKYYNGEPLFAETLTADLLKIFTQL
jgi:2-oxoglutarate ferredoxin oxidoreductase subunit alpha